MNEGPLRAASKAIERRIVVKRLLQGIGLAATGALGGCSANLGAAGVTASTGAAGKVPDPAPRGGENAKIALLLPLSGDPQTAAMALGMRQAAELAMFERGSSPIQLVVKDDKGTPEGARLAAEEALREGAELILGPLFSRSVAAVKPLARKANVPVLAFSNDPSVAGGGAYLLSFSQVNEIDRVVSYAIAKGRRRFAALIPSDAEGKIQEAAFRQAVARGGASVAFLQTYDIGAGGIIGSVGRVRDALEMSDDGSGAVDAIFLPAGQDTLRQVAGMMTALRIDPARVQLLGTSGWDFPSATLVKRAHGGWFASPDPRGWSDLAERYGKAYRTMPPRLASLSHDAVVVAASLATGPKGSRYSVPMLTRATGFTGADGVLHIDPAGFAKRNLAVLELTASGPVVIDRPSPVASASPSVVSSMRLPDVAGSPLHGTATR